MVKDYSVSETTAAAAAAVGTIIWPLAKISFIYSLCLPSPIGRSLICAHLLAAAAAAAAAAEPSRSHFKSL